MLDKTFESLEVRRLCSNSIQSLDGTGNNLQHTTWGSTGVDLLRKSPAAYGDGISTPAGSSRPSARTVSNNIFGQSADLTNNRNLSDLVYVFGQFLDHDIDLTPGGATEPLNVAVPSGDAQFDPLGTGTQTIAMNRSVYDVSTGSSKSNPRQQLNTITAFIDGSQVYGSDATRAAALRTFVGGKLKAGAGNLLPFNTAGLANANDAHIVSDSQLFLAGDVRANENIELTAIQTLFMREHNRIATDLAVKNPTWSDEDLYQHARRQVIAELQSITFNEFLPALLGPTSPGPYRGYDPNTNPGIATEFSTAAFRFGHSMLDNTIDRLNNDGTDIPEGSVDLRYAFFNPTLLDPTLPNNEGNIDPILEGASTGNAQEIDSKVVDDVRNFLFGAPGQGGFDLVSLNIQRGRDHGLADYNTVRAAYGLPRVKTFAQITSDPALQTELKQTYGSVDNVDVWVGGLAEDHTANASVGPLFDHIIADQFSRIRAGDRFWFENVFTGKQLNDLEHTTLAQVMQRNTTLTNLQPDVFLYSSTRPVTPQPNPLPPPLTPRPPSPPQGMTPPPAPRPMGPAMRGMSLQDLLDGENAT